MIERINDSTERLVQRFQFGDERAFEALIDNVRPMIRQEIFRIRHNVSDSDDLGQEALLGVMMAAKRFSAELGTPFESFARVCVRRRLLNAMEKWSVPELPRENSVLLKELDTVPDGSVGDPSDRLMLCEEEVALLDRLRAKLSAMEYAVLMLHLSAYSYDEIAAIRKISVKSVDNALQRVRKKLSADF